MHLGHSMSQATPPSAPTPTTPTATRLSVRAVLAGALFALACDILLTAVGAAMGVTAMSPTAAWSAGIGAGIVVWLVLSLSVSVFFGAWVATAVARSRGRRDGVLHGLVTWAVVTLLALWTVGGTLGAAMGGMFTAVSGARGEPGLPSSAPVRPLMDVASERLPATLDEPGAVAELAAIKRAIALGLWSLSLLLIVPLGASLGGGAVGAQRERRIARRPAAPAADRDNGAAGDGAPAPVVTGPPLPAA